MESIIIENNLAYKSKEITNIVKKMWLVFYEKLEEHKFKTKIGLWTITGGSSAFDLNPISLKPDEYEEAPFIVSVGVDGLSDLSDKIFNETMDLSDDEYIEALQLLYNEFHTWISEAVISVWNSKEIQRIHKQSNFCTSRFGVYSINEQDIAPNELHLMKQLAGSKFK